MSTNIRIVSKVDDEFDITDLFRDAIGRIVGISVFAFNDPIKGFEHFAKNKEEYVLVISDLRMPGPKGLELLKKVKTKRQQVRTILMSAYEVQSDMVFPELFEKTNYKSIYSKKGKIKPGPLKFPASYLSLQRLVHVPVCFQATWGPQIFLPHLPFLLLPPLDFQQVQSCEGRFRLSRLFSDSFAPLLIPYYPRSLSNSMQHCLRKYRQSLIYFQLRI